MFVVHRKLFMEPYMCECLPQPRYSPGDDVVLAYFYVQTNNSVATPDTSLPGRKESRQDSLSLHFLLGYKCNKLATDFD